MPLNHIRPIAICLIHHAGTILGYDAVKSQIFYRPLGGTIEFGESSRQAVSCELREEIDAELTNLTYLSTLENIFTYDGRPGHEIVMVYQADLANRGLYEQPLVVGHEDSGAPFNAVWRPLADFAGGQSPLYPDGLLELLKHTDQGAMK
jgi:hypothetical protein